MSSLTQQRRDLELEMIEDIASFELDPLGFVLYAFPWGVEGTELEEHEGPEDWQVELLEYLADELEKGTSVEKAMPILIARASGHGIGKSALVAWLILWALSTFEDTKGVVTANTETQLKTKTWAELAKWHRLCCTSPWFKFTATALFSVDPKHEKTWRMDMIPWSEKNTEAFAGLHNKGKRILLVFDEGSAIHDAIWEVAEGALTDKDTQIIWAAFGNPTRNTGRFKQCFRRFKHRWNTQQIDSREVTLTNKEQIIAWIEDHGIDSDFIKIRVRGMFPSTSSKQFISTNSVDEAYGRHLATRQYEGAVKVIGVDPAWEGDDEFVIWFRQGLYSKMLAKFDKNDNDVEMAGIIARFEDEYMADGVFVDAGYGTGIVSAGGAMGREWVLVWFQGTSLDPGCLNKRAEMWNSMKRWLLKGGAIPKDEVLYEDLVGPETVPRLDGKIQLEKKADMKKRQLPSPNRADALALTFAYPVEHRDPGSFRHGDGKAASVITDYDPHQEEEY